MGCELVLVPDSTRITLLNCSSVSHSVMLLCLEMTLVNASEFVRMNKITA